MSLARARVAICAVLLLLGGCAKDPTRSPLASGDCRVPPCIQPMNHGTGSAADSGVDAGADAADGS